MYLNEYVNNKSNKMNCLIRNELIRGIENLFMLFNKNFGTSAVMTT